MKYPKMPEEFDRRIKLTSENKTRIRKDFPKRPSLKYFADKYKVSTTTIWLIMNPEKQKEYNARTVEYYRLRRKNDSAYVERQRKLHSDLRKYKRKVQPELQEYYNDINRKHPEYWKRFNKKRWEKIKSNPRLLKLQRKKMLEWVEKNRERKNRKARENYHKRKSN